MFLFLFKYDIMDDLIDQLEYCTVDETNYIPTLIYKLNNTCVNVHDINEYEKSLKIDDNLTVDRLLKKSIHKYYCYLYGLSNWMGFDSFKDKINIFVNMPQITDEQIVNKFFYMKNLDNMLLMIIKEMYVYEYIYEYESY